MPSIKRRVLNPFYYGLRRSLSPLSVSRGGRRRVLVSYLTAAFYRARGLRAAPIAHSNHIESHEIVSAFEELDCAVDVIDFDNAKRIDYSAYDVLFGFGIALEESFFSAAFSGLRIMYLTGANPAFSMAAEAARARDFHRRHGFFPRPRRDVRRSWYYASVNADALFVIGNDWTLSTYGALNANIIALPAPITGEYSTTELTVPAARKQRPDRFLWFGGSGALHKGLDLVIEALAALHRPARLTVCGRIQNETDIVDFYRRQRYEQLQIIWRGFVPVRSAAFRALASDHDFVLLASCSEGTATSVLNCMAEGLVPVVTRECGITVDDFGVAIVQANVPGVVAAIRQACALDELQLGQRKIAAARHARLMHSAAAFRQALREALSGLLDTASADSARGA